MTIRRRRTTVAALLAGGAGAVAIGAVIAVDRALHLIGVLLLPLWEIVTRWVTGEVATPAPPAFLWPALGLIVGIAILAAGWVAVIRGVTLGWPERFDRTRRSLDPE